MRTVALCGVLVSAFPLAAQGQRPAPRVEIMERLRIEHWAFFDPGIAGVDRSYTFAASLLRVGVGGEAKPEGEWQFEVSQVLFAGLPSNAVAPAPAGDLGFGATYRRLNGRRDGGLFLKQAFYRRRNLAGLNSWLRAGRFEFGEGGERMPSHPTLAWLRRARVMERLIGPFGFTPIQRSFDGVEFGRNSSQGAFTLALLRPTRGAFDLKGNDQLRRITFAYASWAFAPEPQSDARLFALHYRDARRPPEVVKVDNRPLAARQADGEPLAITTLGGHFLGWRRTREGRGDFLLWGAFQWGEWGLLNHRAWGLALEGGHQWPQRPGQPWLRVGYFQGSGDGDPNDRRHTTFLQMLPTARNYARTPLFNLMNNRDLFLQLLLRPQPSVSLRLDWHWLWLAHRNDLWYAGGGAFNNSAFGFVGRPSGAKARLMDLADVSLEWRPRPQTTWTLYLGRALGREVVGSSFPGGRRATFAYLEWLQRW